MNITVDIGNTRLKSGIFLPDGRIAVNTMPLPPDEKRFCMFLAGQLLWQDTALLIHGEVLSEINTLTTDVYPDPITWLIALTGNCSPQELQSEILKIRPRDKFKFITRKHIPLKIDADSPGKIGVDRLLAAFAAVKMYGEVPMLIVDAGSAMTVDVVQNRTFCGGAILPGLAAQSEMYPKISEKLPIISISDSFLTNSPVYPGRNTQDAICNGLYWGTIGAIRQFYEMFCSEKNNARLILTGGDAKYLLPGLSQVIPSLRIKYHDILVLEGINRCFGAEFSG